MRIFLDLNRGNEAVQWDNHAFSRERNRLLVARHVCLEGVS